MRVEGVESDGLDFRTFSELSGASKLQGKCRELCVELASDMERDAITVSTAN